LTEKTGKQHIVLCEGFEDRDFWAGWLRHLGCTDPTDRGKKTGKDAWGRPVRGKGRYLFRTPAGSSVVVHPFDGRANARKAVGDYLQGEAHRPDRLVINLDSDAEGGAGVQAEGAWEAVRQIVKHYGGEAAAGSAGPFQVGVVRIFPVIWECDDPETAPGVPKKQTLERLVTAALQAAEPERGPAVDGWLVAEPQAEVTTAKSYSYSYYAKWYGEHGVGDFFQAIWRDEVVARQLLQRLEKTGAWETVVALVED